MTLLRSSNDNVPWEALAAFLADELPSEERQSIERWLAEDPRHEEMLALLRQGWDASAATRRRYDAEAALRWIKGQVPVERQPSRRHVQFAVGSSRWNTKTSRALLAASVAALAIGGWWMASQVGSRAGRVGANATAEYHAARGQRLAFKLPDGSSVMLGPGSTLRVGTSYGKIARAVELEGDGYFEVVHNAARPFSVRTPYALVRDLGTRFVIQAHREDRITDVVVTEGRVALGTSPEASPSDPLSPDSLVLTLNQRGRVTETGTLERTAHVRSNDYLAWTQGQLVFRDVPTAEAIRRIGRWYDVRVRLADTAIARRTITGSFRDEPASEVLRLIAAPLGLRVERAGNEFILRSSER